MAHNIQHLSDEELREHLKRHIAGVQAILLEQQRRFEERKSRLEPGSATPPQAAPLAQ